MNRARKEGGSRGLGTIGDQLRARAGQGGQTPPPPEAPPSTAEDASAQPPGPAGVLPLPKATAETVGYGWTKAHPALAFDKFAFWLVRWKTKAEGRQSPKYEFLKHFSNAYRAHPVAAFYRKAAIDRREAFFQRLEQSGWIVRKAIRKTSWRMVSGMGIPHPFETGFVLDRSCGVPFLPGSSLKGAARAWATVATAEGIGAWQTRPGGVDAVFGPRHDGPSIDGENVAQGGAVFFDAYPTTWPRIEVDLLNPHYKEYYDSLSRGAVVPPADYLGPTPIYFLAVAADQPFEFAVAARTNLPAALLDAAAVHDAGEFVDLAIEAAVGAACNAGLGGKTATGYGYFDERDAGR